MAKTFFEFYLIATEKDGKNGKDKTSVLLTCSGQKGRENYETFNFDNLGAEKRLASVLQKFSEHCYPRKSITSLFRHIFLHTDNMKGKTSLTPSQS